MVWKLWGLLQNCVYVNTVNQLRLDLASVDASVLDDLHRIQCPLFQQHWPMFEGMSLTQKLDFFAASSLDTTERYFLDCKSLLLSMNPTLSTTEIAAECIQEIWAGGDFAPSESMLRDIRWALSCSLSSQETSSSVLMTAVTDYFEAVTKLELLSRASTTKNYFEFFSFFGLLNPLWYFDDASEVVDVSLLAHCTLSPFLF